MAFAICKTSAGEHVPAVLLAETECETPALAEQTEEGYCVTNRYADGTVGLSERDAECAEADDSPWCAEHREEIDHWHHGATPPMPIDLVEA